VKDEQASSTALLIAASMVLMHDHPLYPDAVPDTAAELSARILESYSRTSRFFLDILRRSWFRSIAAAVERTTIPGIMRHYAMRKKCIAQLARDAVRDGIAQIVILGAGFDSLAIALRREFADVRFWEIDHPATQRYKESVAGSIDPSRFQFIGANLTAVDLREALSTSGSFRSEQRTLWIAEGLFMYFPERTVSRLFELVRNMSAPRSRFIFTFMQRNSAGHVRFRNQTKLVDLWLQLRGEPFRWGIARENLTKFISPWQVLRIYDENDLSKLDSAAGNRTLAAGEIICLAEI
jgi:methyltransferase (TIGR00027 family)